MHSQAIQRLRHDHYDATDLNKHESRTRWVVLLTFAMMIGELVVGNMTNSLALTADGWHMATHAGALGLAAFAYWFARTRAREASFSFGTGKVHALSGYTSAVALAGVASWMLFESVKRLLSPEKIHFAEALPVAVLGLLVNLVSVKLLHSEAPGHAHEHDEHDHDHHDHGGHDHAEHDHAEHDHAEHDHEEHDHRDHNLRAAYFHVLADAFTSVLAICALTGGRYFGWAFLDPMMGIVGGVVILRWSYGLCKGAARQLLDMVPSKAIADGIQSRLEKIGDTRVVDLHLWEVGPNRNGCIVSLVTSEPRTPEEYRAVINESAQLTHVTVEVNRCPEH